jgi:hypothetical protein
MHLRVNAPGIDPAFFEDATMLILKARMLDRKSAASRLCNFDLVAEAKALAVIIRDVYRAEPVELEVIAETGGFFRSRKWPDGLAILRSAR